MKQDVPYKCPRLSFAGEALLIVEFGSRLTPAINDAAIGFDHFLQGNVIAGLRESAPTSRSVLLRFDPLEVAPDVFRSKIEELTISRDWASLAQSIEKKRWRMPICYGGECGPDLVDVAKRLKRSAEELVAAHLSLPQRVFMIGFAPGFLYTGLLPELFNLPRLKTIKPEVPPGSVSVAVGQSVISSTPNPTGWHTIGRTPFLNFVPARQPAFMIGAGDEIVFYEIDRLEFDDLRSTPGQGLEPVNASKEVAS